MAEIRFLPTGFQNVKTAPSGVSSFPSSRISFRSSASTALFHPFSATEKPNRVPGAFARKPTHSGFGVDEALDRLIFGFCEGLRRLPLALESTDELARSEGLSVFASYILFHRSLFIRDTFFSARL